MLPLACGARQPDVGAWVPVVDLAALFEPHVACGHAGRFEGQARPEPLEWVTLHCVAASCRPLGGLISAARTLNGSSDAQARLWDPTIGQPLSGHTSAVLSVTFGVADGRTVLASVSGHYILTEELWLVPG